MQQIFPEKSNSLFSDIYYFIIKKPAIDTLIRFNTPEERENFSQRILQRLDVGVKDYTILNVHKIGINSPGRFIYDDLMTWNNDSTFWPNNLARVKRINKSLDQVEIYLFGMEKLLSLNSIKFSGFKIPKLFFLNKVHTNKKPQTSDVDNARSILYKCGGGYPIGFFSLYVRSSISEMKEKETSQLFFMVAFDFYGQHGWFYAHLMQKLWKKIHNRVTAHVMNRLKYISEYNFSNITLT